MWPVIENQGRFIRLPALDLRYGSVNEHLESKRTIHDVIDEHDVDVVLKER